MSSTVKMVVVLGLAALGIGSVPTAAAAQQWVAAWGSSLQGASPEEWSMTDANRDLINPIYDCDGIHPNTFGYAAMGRSIDLGVFGERQ